MTVCGLLSLGVCLVAVLDSMDAEPCIKLNPGPDYILKGTDYCFYMSLTKEEYSKVTMPLDEEATSPMSAERLKNIGTFVTCAFWDVGSPPKFPSFESGWMGLITLHAVFVCVCGTVYDGVCVCVCVCV